MSRLLFKIHLWCVVLFYVRRSRKYTKTWNAITENEGTLKENGTQCLKTLSVSYVKCPLFFISEILFSQGFVFIFLVLSFYVFSSKLSFSLYWPYLSVTNRDFGGSHRSARSETKNPVNKTSITVTDLLRVKPLLIIGLYSLQYPIVRQS